MCNEEFRVLITFKRNQRVIIRQLILWRQFVQKSYSESSWGQLILLTIIHKTFLFSYLAVRLSTTDLFLIFAAKLNLFHGRNPIVLDLGPWSIFDLHQSLISVNSSVLILVNSWSLSIFDPWSNSLILVNFLLILSMFPFIRMVKYHCLAPALFFFWSVYCNPPASLTSFFFFYIVFATCIAMNPWFQLAILSNMSYGTSLVTFLPCCYNLAVFSFCFIWDILRILDLNDSQWTSPNTDESYR